MASKDHTLDGRIDAAAMAEFLANGFEKASLRKIAANAGVTVGAIYTRYRTKDTLFCTLVQPLIERIGQTFSEIKADYFEEIPHPGMEQMALSMQKETDAILHLLFDDYDRAVLLLCKSTGSSLEPFFDTIVEQKIAETAAFFRQAGIQEQHPGTFKLLIDAQFRMYFQIIKEGYELDDAREIMQTAAVYHTAGWMAVLGSQPKLTGGTP